MTESSNEQYVGAKIMDCPHLKPGEVYGFICYSPHKASYKQKCPTRCTKQYRLLHPLDTCSFFTGDVKPPKNPRRYRTREEHRNGVKAQDGSINPRTWRRRKKAELEAMTPEERQAYDEYRKFARELWETKRQDITEAEYEAYRKNNRRS